MKLGIISLYCPMCGSRFEFAGYCISGIMDSEFGYVCSKSCYKTSKIKYVHMILGHDDPIKEHK